MCGWCTNGTKCLLSHDTERIIQWHENDTKKNKKKRKRQQERKQGEEDGAPDSKVPHMEVDDDQQGAPEPLANEKGEGEGDGEEEKVEEEVHQEDGDMVSRRSPNHEEDNQSADGPKKTADSGLHRAGFDAFMTGFILAHACALAKGDGAGEERREPEEEQQSWLPACLNKVYLSRKTVPLNVVKSSFSKSSKAHQKKMEMVWGTAA